jgi:hypothetical protein
LKHTFLKTRPDLAFFLLAFLCSSLTFSQQKTYEDINYKKYLLNISARDSVINLPDKFLIKEAVTVYSDSADLSPETYTIDHRYGKIILKRFIIEEILKDPNPERTSILVTYKNLPFDIQDSYSRFEILSKIDTSKIDTVKVAEIKSILLKIFLPAAIQKSGSLFRGFTIGNNRDLTLQSGFRLQMTASFQGI